MPVKSLMEIATAACIKNIRELESVGDYLPYENVRNILMRVDNAYQLRQIELNSPQLDGETGEIWLKIIQRDFPMEYKATAYKPPNPSKWYRVWERYKKDHDQALQESEAKLMSALNGLKQTKIMNTSRIVDRKLLPRTGPKRGWQGPRDHTTTTLAFARGSRTKTANGASVMRKVRREVKEIASIHGALSRPVRGSAALSRPSKAPAAMVNEYRRAAQPVFRPTPKEELSSAVMEHEERATFISDSEEDDNDDNELFDEDEPPSSRAPAPKSFARSSAASLLKKRPGASSSASPTKSYTPSSASSAPRTTTKRPGLLSNSYKSSAVKPQVTTKKVSAPPRSASSPEPYKPPQRLPRDPTSPPPALTQIPSSPPPTADIPAPLTAQPRKRKAVDIFMKRKKRA
ncbi:RNA polymerase II transcription factor SIII subunit A,putative [Dactylonectria estremocensis]|uniref:RNA polymerase II transcription factor SIII subunit A,putative n=1 Tax=Dactylonectria estremocensis TaxID=1079267 RepID=A0A9P9FKV6_9HYPO|nr:RNA polymerase II transcription factor SIII subunit A,putative [Dactylonectria estremocensis]